MLETVRGAVRRLSKISNCAFECDYYYHYYYYIIYLPLTRREEGRGHSALYSV